MQEQSKIATSQKESGIFQRRVTGRIEVPDDDDDERDVSQDGDDDFPEEDESYHGLLDTRT